jgi:hypothetical protein
MGRLIPVFEKDDQNRMLFQGKFKDEDTGLLGYLEVMIMPGTPEGARVTSPSQFVHEPYQV